MPRMIFVNLPVKDLASSRGFFRALGFEFNEDFSDDRAACVVLADNIFVMLLREDFFATLLNGEVADASSTEVVNCLSASTRNEVDDLVRRAVEAGGKPWKDTFSEGPMYGGSFQDLDGHVWEVMYMDTGQAAG